MWVKGIIDQSLVVRRCASLSRWYGSESAAIIDAEVVWLDAEEGGYLDDIELDRARTAVGYGRPSQTINSGP